MKRHLLSCVAMLALAAWQLTAAPQQTAAGDRQLAAAKHKATVDGRSERCDRAVPAGCRRCRRQSRAGGAGARGDGRVSFEAGEC